MTFFEILIGRTPFEHSEGEQFSTKDDLEKYWERTLRGKWVGAWKMSKGVEKLLRRMILPNADLRCNASQAMEDSYWTTEIEVPTKHAHSTYHLDHSQSGDISNGQVLVPAEKSASMSHSRTSSLALDIMSPWTTRTNRDLNRDKDKKDKDKSKDKGKEKEKHHHKAAPAVGKENAAAPKHAQAAPARSGHARSQSQPKLQLAAAAVEGRTRPFFPAPLSLSLSLVRTVADLASLPRRRTPGASARGVLRALPDQALSSRAGCDDVRRLHLRRDVERPLARCRRRRWEAAGARGAQTPRAALTRAYAPRHSTGPREQGKRTPKSGDPN